MNLLKQNTDPETEMKKYYLPAKAARYMKSHGMDYMAACKLIDATEPTRQIDIPGEPGFFAPQWSEDVLDKLIKDHNNQQGLIADKLNQGLRVLDKY